MGLLSIATVLKEKGYNVEILNFDYLFINILPYSHEPLENLEKMTKFILEKKPDVVGFTTMCHSFHNSLLLSRMIKEKNCNIKVIFGGPHASILPEKILEKYDFVDLVCVGEGEKKIDMIIKSIELNEFSSVPGIVYRQDGVIIRNNDVDIISNLDELPMMDYTLIPYFEKCKFVPIDIGRGCPYRCIYCSTSRYWKHKFRMKSIDRVIKEILEIKNIMKNRKFCFEFVHDNVTTDYKYIMALCDRLKELNIEWSCSSRVDRLDEELIKKLSNSGCKEICMGIESASKAIQTYINKNINLNMVYPVIDAILKNNMKPIISFMYGFPGETEEDLDFTFTMIYNLLKKGVKDCPVYSLCILGGTEIFDKCRDRLILKDNYSDFSEASNINLCKHFISDDIELFSHFYTLKESLIDRYPLLDKFVFYIFVSLYSYIPKTLNLILKVFGHKVLNFYHDFILINKNFTDFFVSRRYISDFIEPAEITLEMISFIEEYLNKKNSDERFKMAINTFSMENLKFKMKYYPVTLRRNLDRS